MIDAGKLNRRISIQRQSTTQDEAGQPIQTWSEVYSCWASIDIQNSQLIYATQEFLEKVTHRLTIRWTKSVIFTPDMRVQYVEQGTGITHTYQIQALLNTKEANKELVIMAYEINGAQ